MIQNCIGIESSKGKLNMHF